MKIICAGCHIGQARALELVAERLVAQGHAVTVVLDKGHEAAKLYSQEGLRFQGCDVAQVHGDSADSLKTMKTLFQRFKPDRALTMLSPTENTDSVEHQLSCIAKMLHVPVFGYAEVPCGHLAPVWNGFLSEFQILFVAQETRDLEEFSNVLEVGSVDTPVVDLAAALRTKQRLGMTEGSKWIWFAGAPYVQSGIILQHVVEFIHRFDSSIKIVFSRHQRKRDDEELCGAYRAVFDVAQQMNVSVIENRTKDEASVIENAELLNACALNGIIITGHGTDGMVHAPRMEIPSILCVGNTLNPVIYQEKRHDVLPLPPGCPIQVISEPLLFAGIVGLFRGGKDDYLGLCRKYYPRPEKSSSQIVAQEIILDV